MCKTRPYSLCSLVFLFTILCAGMQSFAATNEPSAIAPASEWTMGRGSLQRTGASASTLAEQPKLLWRLGAKGGYQAEAAIVSGVVYAVSEEGDFKAIHLATGKPLWEVKLAVGVGASAPCVSGGRIYFGDSSGTFHCLNASTGKDIWAYPTGKEIQSSAAMVGNMILFGSYDETLHCLNAQTGKEAWFFKTQGPVHCSPSIHNGLAFIAGCDHTLRAIDINTGKEKWNLTMPSYAAASPVVSNGLVFVAHFGSGVLAADAEVGKKEWEYKPYVSKDPAQKTGQDFPFYATCAVAGDRVIACGRDKKVHCIDMKQKGAPVWTFTTKGEIDASPCVVGSRVYAASKDGTIYGLDLADGKEKWHFVAGAPFTASPVVASGVLVIGDSQGTLYCFGSEKEK